MCIDNDSDDCLKLLIEHFHDIYDKEVLKEGNWILLVQRCLMLNSNKCLREILKTKKIEFTSIEMELAVYFADKNIVLDIFQKHYENILIDDRKLEENVIKACIYKKNLEYIQCLLDITKVCAKEHEKVISKSIMKNYLTTQIYNFEYLKGKKDYAKIPFTKIYEDFNDNNILQYAIENSQENIAIVLLETNVNLNTVRESDKATALILATRVTSL